MCALYKAIFGFNLSLKKHFPILNSKKCGKRCSDRLENAD